MRFNSRVKFKKIILPFLAILAASAAIMLIFFFIMRQQYIAMLNRETTGYIEMILEHYPEITEAELIASLKDNVSSEAARELLSKYGYDGYELLKRDSGILLDRFLIMTAIILALFAFGILSWILYYNSQREKKVYELLKYVRDINRGVYALRIEDNSEDELSLLSNEICKIMVLLREASENSRIKSRNLSIALADISHQIKTPLTSVQLLLDSIYEDPDMPDQTRKEFLRSANDQLSSISSLVVTLLNIAKFDSGTVKMNPTGFRIGELFEDVRESLEILIDVSNVSLEMEGDLDTYIVLDRKWQGEAIKNIVKNAVEHSPDPGAVRIKAENNSIFLKITIRDEGEGISDKDLHHIFERFYRAENASEGSVGIGLSFAKTVIEKENGLVSVSSVKGEGTVFTVVYKK